MKFIKTYEGYFDTKTGKVIDTGDLKIYPKTPVQENEPENINSNSNDKLKFSKGASPLKTPSWVKDPSSWASDELVKLLEVTKSSEYGELGNVKFGNLSNVNMFANWYSNCFSKQDPNAVPDVTKRLKTLLVELKTKNLLRIKDAVRVFFDNVGPKLSDVNVSEWLKSKDEFKRRDIIKFEQLCSQILAS